MKQNTSQRRWLALAAWLFGVAVCVVIIARTTFTADLSAFLPQSPTKEQQVLLDQLRDGVVSRLTLIGIEGADAPTRVALSKETAKRLRGNPAFITVNNGEPVNTGRDQAYLFENRYLLSASVNPDRFTVAGLRDAVGNTINLLASPAGMLIKPLLPRDPTGETVELVGQMDTGNRPQMNNGVWVSRDGQRAVLLVQTRAAGADIDGQQQAMTQIRAAFNAATQQQGTIAATLAMTGPGVFSVLSRNTIKSEVERLSIIGTCIIIGLLLIVYRSFTALALGLLPVVSGALVGVVAVSLGFGLVHGLTLGFGTTLIGEAVDYSIYLFVQSRQANAGTNGTSGDWVTEFWPTIRLGVLTSIVGFSSLLLSSFPGLAQLGLYSIAGLVAAAVVTRFVLPHLLPQNFRIRDVSAVGGHLAKIARWMPALRWPLIILSVAACVVMVQYRTTLWNTELSSLSPVSRADQAVDERLRADIGAPDTRYMIAVSAGDRESALQAAEKIAEQLQALVDKDAIAGFESPSRYLPSVATQKARQASLPSASDLDERLKQAVVGMPVRADLFKPFLADVAATKNRPPLQRADLDNSSLALAVDSLLFQRGAQWNALLPLSVSATGGASGLSTDMINTALRAAGQPNALFVDMKSEYYNLYSNYFHEAVILSLGGLAGIVVLLLLSLRSPLQVARILFPLIATVVTVVALLTLFGHRLTILHLVGLLLIIAVGSNYALFFSGQAATDESKGITPQTLTSLVFANLTTVAGFGILGFSSVPVLQAIGITVGPGAVLALIFAASFAGKKPTSAAAG